MPQKQPKRGRLWLNDASCIRLRPEYQHYVWTYDFVMDRTRSGKQLKLLNIIDEYSRLCFDIVVDRQLKADDVIHTLAGLFVRHAFPAHICSDNGNEFTAKQVRS